jgi:hypothetical protein
VETSGLREGGIFCEYRIRALLTAIVADSGAITGETRRSAEGGRDREEKKEKKKRRVVKLGGLSQIPVRGATKIHVVLDFWFSCLRSRRLTVESSLYTRQF